MDLDVIWFRSFHRRQTDDNNQTQTMQIKSDGSARVEFRRRAFLSPRWGPAIGLHLFLLFWHRPNTSADSTLCPTLPREFHGANKCVIDRTENSLILGGQIMWRLETWCEMWRNNGVILKARMMRIKNPSLGQIWGDAAQQSEITQLSKANKTKDKKG